MRHRLEVRLDRGRRAPGPQVTAPSIIATTIMKMPATNGCVEKAERTEEKGQKERCGHAFVGICNDDGCGGSIGHRLLPRLFCWFDTAEAAVAHDP